MPQEPHQTPAGKEMFELLNGETRREVFMMGVKVAMSMTAACTDQETCRG